MLLLPLWFFVMAPMPLPAVSATPYSGNLAAEYVLCGSTFATTAILSSAVKRTLGGNLPCRTLDDGARCDPAALYSIDRHSVGLLSRPWSVVGDLGQGAALGGSALMVLGDALLHHAGRPYLDASTDFLMLVESVAVSTAATQLLKFAVRRPRPQLYTVGTHRGVEAELSFPSGHTAATASALTAWATIFWQRHPTSRWRYLPYLVSFAMTGVVGYGRVATPKHFATDVLVGALMGGAIGFAVPTLHLKSGGTDHALQLEAEIVRSSEANAYAAVALVLSKAW